MAAGRCVQEGKGKRRRRRVSAGKSRNEQEEGRVDQVERDFPKVTSQGQKLLDDSKE